MRDVTLTQLYNEFRVAEGRIGRPLSHRAAAARAGVPGMYETFRKIGTGSHRGNLDEDTIRALVQLGLAESAVRRAIGLHEVPAEPFTLPKNADRLTLRQREAVLSVIRAMLEPTGADPAARRMSPDDRSADIAIRRQQRAEKAAREPAPRK